jgi:hypothetical protein
MTDPVMHGFLRRQYEDGLALACESDFVHIATPGRPADRFLVRFTCQGLVKDGDRPVETASDFLVGIWFPPDYLRTADPFQVLTWMGPRHVWHPNISAEAPFICVGRLTPGTGLVDLIYQCWEIITWTKKTIREDDALNKAACQWARANLHRLPVDTRPLKRRALNVNARDVSPSRPVDGVGPARVGEGATP